jgi:rRNA maturation protein Nop10
MVYYMTEGSGGSRRVGVPPVCPKCGSHRTQIIGTFGDGNTLNIRCATCGEVSTVPVPNADGLGNTSTAEPAERFEEELQQAVAVVVPR